MVVYCKSFFLVFIFLLCYNWVMENQEIHIGIIGAGRIGTAIYGLLVGKGSDYKISIPEIP